MSWCLLVGLAGVRWIRTESAACPACRSREIVQWKNPALSALVLLLGSFCALAGEFILRGDHKVTPLKGARPLLHIEHSAPVSHA